MTICFEVIFCCLWIYHLEAGFCFNLFTVKILIQLRHCYVRVQNYTIVVLLVPEIYCFSDFNILTWLVDWKTIPFCKKSQIGKFDLKVKENVHFSRTLFSFFRPPTTVNLRGFGDCWPFHRTKGQINHEVIVFKTNWMCTCTSLFRWLSKATAASFHCLPHKQPGAAKSNGRLLHMLLPLLSHMGIL